MKKDTINKISLSAVFLALGFVLPFLTGQIPQIGSMLLPMHIPVFLCAFICGWQYALPVAFLLPLLRTMIFGVPNLYPESISIAFEMSAYAFVCGFSFAQTKNKNTSAIYGCLLISMAVGRIVRAFVQLVLLGISKTPFTFGAFFTGVIIKGIPGIILQLILVPSIIVLFQKLLKKTENSKT